MKKNKLLLIIFLLFLFVLSIYNVEARSGCCSHHGGVCGCRCCDGTSLSATCAPYYPQCSQPVRQKAPTPTKPISSESKSEISENDLPSQIYNPNKYIAQISNEDDNSIFGGILWLGIGGFITYLFLRRKK